MPICNNRITLKRSRYVELDVFDSCTPQFQHHVSSRSFLCSDTLGLVSNRIDVADLKTIHSTCSPDKSRVGYDFFSLRPCCSYIHTYLKTRYSSLFDIYGPESHLIKISTFVVENLGHSSVAINELWRNKNKYLQVVKNTGRDRSPPTPRVLSNSRGRCARHFVPQIETYGTRAATQALIVEQKPAERL